MDKFASRIEAVCGRLAALRPRDAGSDPERITLETETFEEICGALEALREENEQRETARRTAEAALRARTEELKQSEERFRLLVDSLPIAVYTCDQEGRIDLFNEQAAALWKRRPEIGKDQWCGSWRIFRPDGSPLPLEQCPMAVALREGRRVLDQEIVVERPDGTRAWVLPFPQPLRDPEGGLAGAVNVLMDVTPLKQAEQALRASTEELRRAHDELEMRVQERTAELRAEIGERERAEQLLRARTEELKQSEERYRRIVELADEGIWTIDAETHTTYVNPRMAEMLGYGVEELLGRSAADFVDPADRGEAEQQWELRQRGVPQRSDMRCRRKNGSLLWLACSTTSLFDEDGRFAGAFGMFTDITERKRAEEAQARFAAILEATTDFVGMADAELRPLYLNRAGRQMLGLRPKEAIPETSIFDSHPEWVRKLFVEEAIPAARRDGVWSGEAALLGRDGQEIPVSQVLLAHKNAAGDVAFFSTIARDITERKRAEAALRESEERLRSAFDNAAIGMALVGTDGRFLQVNRSLCAILGYSAEELTARDFKSITHPDDLSVDLEQRQRMRTGEIRSYEREKRYLHKRGHVVWAQLSVSTVRDGDEGPFYFISQIQDITKRKRAEEALRESEERFTAFMDNSPAAAFMKDEEGRYVYANQRCERQLQTSLIGKTDFDLLPAEMAKQLRQNDRAALCAVKAVEIVETAPGSDGAPHHWLTFKFPVTDASGRRFVGGMAVDITGRKRAEHVARGQTAALARTLDALTARPELDTFLGQVLAAIAEQLDSGYTSLWFYDAEQDSLLLHLAHDGGRILRREPHAVLALPLWREMVRTRRPVVIDDTEGDPCLSSYECWPAGAQTLLLVPLLLGDEAIGLLSISSDERRQYRPEEIELARALAQQATLAVQLTRLAEHEQQGAVLRERNRMAREIHDTLAQGFTGILLQLEAAEYVLTRRPEEARTCITRAHNLARESLAEARRSVWALRPQVLEQGDLALALAGLAEQMTVGTPTRAEFHVHGPRRPLPAEMESDLLRIGLEALTNALKHAGARTVHIDLGFEPDAVRLSVRDDGRGFEPARQAAAEGFGLTSMRERAERLGGRLTISGRPGAGTEVVVTAPAVSKAGLP